MASAVLRLSVPLVSLVQKTSDSWSRLLPMSSSTWLWLEQSWGCQCPLYPLSRKPRTPEAGCCLLKPRTPGSSRWPRSRYEVEVFACHRMHLSTIQCTESKPRLCTACLVCGLGWDFFISIVHCNQKVQGISTVEQRNQTLRHWKNGLLMNSLYQHFH